MGSRFGMRRSKMFQNETVAQLQGIKYCRFNNTYKMGTCVICAFIVGIILGNYLASIFLPMDYDDDDEDDL